MSRVFDTGDRVTTPSGPGEVVWKRMAPPDYSQPAAYSVKLDSKKDDPNYTGSMFGASAVKEEP